MAVNHDTTAWFIGQLLANMVGALIVSVWSNRRCADEAVSKEPSGWWKAALTAARLRADRRKSKELYKRLRAKRDAAIKEGRR